MVCNLRIQSVTFRPRSKYLVRAKVTLTCRHSCEADVSRARYSPLVRKPLPTILFVVPLPAEYLMAWGVEANDEYSCHTARHQRRASTRFALTLDVRYTIPGGHAPAQMGAGCTVDLSSSGLRFNADRHY